MLVTLLEMVNFLPGNFSRDSINFFSLIPLYRELNVIFLGVEKSLFYLNLSFYVNKRKGRIDGLILSHSKFFPLSTSCLKYRNFCTDFFHTSLVMHVCVSLELIFFFFFCKHFLSMTAYVLFTWRGGGGCVLKSAVIQLRFSFSCLVYLGRIFKVPAGAKTMELFSSSLLRIRFCASVVSLI